MRLAAAVTFLAAGSRRDYPGEIWRGTAFVGIAIVTSSPDF